MENVFNLGHDMIILNNQEKFVNAVSEIMEGDFHPSNPKLNLVGDYSKCVNCGDLDSVILYDIMHEKEHQRMCIFNHMINPFWLNYQSDYTRLEISEKYIIFLKVLNEVSHIYSKHTLRDIKHCMFSKLNLSDKEVSRITEGKMWHDYFMSGYIQYVMSKNAKYSTGLYY